MGGKLRQSRKEVGEVGMTEFERAQLIAGEINCLHEDLLMCARSMHRTVFVFFTVFVGALGIFFGKGMVDENQKRALILILSQVEVVLFLFLCSLYSYQNVHTGYIRGLEHKFNELVKDKIKIWESKIVPSCMARPSCPFFVTCCLQCIAYIAIFVVLIYFSFRITKHIVWCVGFTLEVAIMLALVLWILREPEVIEKFAKKELGVVTKQKEQL